MVMEKWMCIRGGTSTRKRGDENEREIGAWDVCMTKWWALLERVWLGVRECWAWGRWCVGRGEVGCFVYLEGADREIRCMMGGMTCWEYGWGGCCGDGEVDV